MKFSGYDADLSRTVIAQQKAKMLTYMTLLELGLPIPADLRRDVEEKIPVTRKILREWLTYTT